MVSRLGRAICFFPGTNELLSTSFSTLFKADGCGTTTTKIGNIGFIDYSLMVRKKVQYSLRKIPYPKSQHFKWFDTVRFSSTNQILGLQPWSKHTKLVRRIHPHFKIAVYRLSVQQITTRCLLARSSSFWYQNDARNVFCLVKDENRREVLQGMQLQNSNNVVYCDPLHTVLRWLPLQISSVTSDTVNMTAQVLKLHFVGNFFPVFVLHETEKVPSITLIWWGWRLDQ